MKNYEINAETLAIIPYGRGRSKVYERNDEFIVDMLPLNIIKNSCLFFGSSFEGRKKAAKEILSIEMKVPIIIEESRKIIFFPVIDNSDSTSWISFQNLVNYSRLGNLSTRLYFGQDVSITVDVRYNLVDNQFIRSLKFYFFLDNRINFLKNKCLIDNQ